MMLCGLYKDFKKRNSSSNSSRSNDSLVNTVGTDFRSKYAAELTSTCREDAYLKSFESSLQQRTNRFIGSLNANSETQRSLSLESLIEVFGCLSDLNQDALNVIIESREDVWKNNDLRSLVETYFKSTSKALDFCNNIEKCVKKIENRQLIIRIAVKKFERESSDTDLGENSKKKKTYGKTLEELNKFKAMGDPFGEEFLTQSKSVFEQQVQLLKELHKQKLKLDKRDRNAKTRSTLPNVVFSTVYASTFVLSMVLSPAMASALAAELRAPTNETGNWFSDMLKEHEKAVGRQKGLVLERKSGAEAIKIATESIENEVDKLRSLISSFQESGREEEEEAIEISMAKIEKEVDEFTDKIKEVGEYATKYRKFIVQGRDDVMKRILE